MLGARNLLEDSMMVNYPSLRSISNSYIPDITKLKSSIDALPRKAVIDACNVARAASGHKRKRVACDALLSLVRYLLVRRFDVHLFIPIHYRNPALNFIDHAAVLEHLERLELLTFTSARKKTEERAGFQNYDDLFILEHAEQSGGFVLSGDRYDDILRKNEYVHMHHVIRNRRVEPLWRDNCGRIFGKSGIDRFGRHIPDLVTTARFHQYPGKDLSNIFYCRSEDPSYEKVRQAIRSEEACEKLIAEIDKLMDELETTGTVHSLTPSNSANIPRSSSFPNQRSRAIFEPFSKLAEGEDNLSDLFSTHCINDLMSPALPPAADRRETPIELGSLPASTAHSSAAVGTAEEENEEVKSDEKDPAPVQDCAEEDFADRLRKKIRKELSGVFEEWVVDRAMDERESVVDISLIANRCTEILDALPC